MTIFDYALLVVLFLSGTYGFSRGFVKEILSIVAYILSLWASLHWGGEVAQWLEEWVMHPYLRLTLAYAFVFILSLFVAGLVIRFLRSILAFAGLGGFDRMMGFVFGVVRGIFLILLLVWVAGHTPLPQEPWWQQSYFSPIAIDVLKAINAQLPSSVHQYFPY